MENKQMIKQTKHGWMDFSNLPKRTNGKIHWNHVEGYMIPFKYDDIISQCVINKVLDNKYLDISIDGYIDSYVIKYDNLSCGKLGYALQKLSTNFLFNVGDIIGNNLLITSQYREDGRKKYGYICIKDGHVGCIAESDAKRGQGCPVCCGHVVIIGKTDIATTHPNIASLFWNKEDTYLYSAKSGRRIDFRCPYCNNKINARIENVTNFGLSCPKCGDGFSYPEKFVFNVLEQVFTLHLDLFNGYRFETQKKFDWSKNTYHDNSKLSGSKKYDFYISMQNDIIIETHGKQHYENSVFSTHGNVRTLQEEQENDIIKKSLAIQNGISDNRYIILDCRQSSVEYIKKSIMSSNLPSLLDFTECDIDWYACNAFATSSRVYEACELWNSGIHVITNIANKMKIDRNTVSFYLRRGEELGIVQDSTKHIKKKTIQN